MPIHTYLITYYNKAKTFSGYAFVTAYRPNFAQRTLENQGRYASTEGYSVISIRDVGCFGNYEGEGIIFEGVSPDGMSAYEIAVKYGYKGTEEEWIKATISGMKGDKGDTGETGQLGEKGEDSLYVLVFTDTGNILLNSDSYVTLTAEVWSGYTELISTYNLYSSAYFSWTRVSSDTEADTIWNNNHKNTGYQIKIPKLEFNKKAMYQCTFNLELFLENYTN